MKIVRCPKCKQYFVAEPEYIPHQIVVEINVSQSYQITYTFLKGSMETTLVWGSYVFNVKDRNPISNSSEGILKLTHTLQILYPKLTSIWLVLLDDIVKAALLAHQLFLRTYEKAEPVQVQLPPNTSIVVRYCVAVDGEMLPCHLELHCDEFWIYNPIVKDQLSQVELFGRKWRVRFVWPTLNTGV